jgi:AcrR family transcriptional regulator
MAIATARVVVVMRRAGAPRGSVCRLIAQRGLEGLRFADVARAAGINNGTLLYYFAGKNALIEAVGKFLVDQYVRAARRPRRIEPSSR